MLRTPLFEVFAPPSAPRFRRNFEVFTPPQTRAQSCFHDDSKFGEFLCMFCSISAIIETGRVRHVTKQWQSERVVVTVFHASRAVAAHSLWDSARRELASGFLRIYRPASRPGLRRGNSSVTCPDGRKNSVLSLFELRQFVARTMLAYPGGRDHVRRERGREGGGPPVRGRLGDLVLGSRCPPRGRGRAWMLVRVVLERWIQGWWWS